MSRSADAEREEQSAPTVGHGNVEVTDGQAAAQPGTGDEDYIGQPWSKFPDEVRLAQLGKLFVARNVEEQIVKTIDRARSQRLRYPEARSIAITGETGVGKSFIAERYYRDNREHRDPETQCIVRPVLYVNVRNSSTPKAVARAMLRALGLSDNERPDFDPSVTAEEQEEADKEKFHWRGVPELTHQVKVQMVGQKVEVCILDEFHNTITDNGAVRLNRIAEWVKDFIKSKERTARYPNGRPEENIVFVLIGTKKVLKIVDPTVNEELASITPYRQTVDRYRYDTDATKEEFADFLFELDDELPFDEHSGLRDLADKFHIASYGLVRQVAYIVTLAAELAIEDGSAKVEEHHLHTSIELQRGVLESHLLSSESEGEDRRLVENPFMAPMLVTNARGPMRKSGRK